MVPDKTKEVYEELDDESARLLMKERADLAGITSAYFEHSSIHGLRYVPGKSMNSLALNSMILVFMMVLSMMDY